MTKLLDKALAEVSKLPKEEQDALATWILQELASERCWEKLFTKSPDLLARFADETLSEHRKGQTQPLDSDKL